MYKAIEKSFWTVFVHRICVLIIALLRVLYGHWHIC